MKKFLIFFLVLISVGYFGAGYYVYDIAASVPCAVWEGEQGNIPSNFEIWEDYRDTINASDYFIDSYEDVSFPSTDDVVISGWWMEQNPGGPTVIVNHGLTSSKYSSGILLASGILYRNGFNVLAIDLRDHGDSTCEDGYYSAGQKESYDSAAAVNWLVDKKGIPPSALGIYGQSLGALTALTTSQHTNNFSAIAVHDPPVNFETLVREEMEYQGFPAFLFEPTSHYARIFEGISLTNITPETSLTRSVKQPILIFNGMLDERVLPHHSLDLVDLADSLGIKTELYRYEDAGHVQSLWTYTDEFEQIIVRFFQDNLTS